MPLYEVAGRPLQDAADFAIVGSGPAGAACAWWLTRAGFSVLVLEAGGTPAAVAGDGWPALQQLYRDAGATLAIGKVPMSLLQAKVLGGGSAVGAVTHQPLPEEVYAEWLAGGATLAQQLSFAELEAAREAVESALAVTKTPPALWGPSGQALMQGFGGRATATWRHAPSCRGSGRCFQGCPNGAWTGPDSVFLAGASESGARLYTGVQVERITHVGGQVSGVIGKLKDGQRVRVGVRKAVILAAGALGSIALLHASGLPAAGTGVSCHPIATVAGLLHKPVQPEPGATHAVVTDALRDYRVEVFSTVQPRTWRALQVPGMAEELQRRLGQLDHLITWQLLLRPEAKGRVLRRPWAKGRLQFQPNAVDLMRLRQGIVGATEAMLQAGALEVWTGLPALPVVTSVKQARSVAIDHARPQALTTSHFFGGLQLDARFQPPGVRGLVVADAAALPGPTGVGPLSTILSVATAISQRWV